MGRPHPLLYTLSSSINSCAIFYLATRTRQKGSCNIWRLRWRSFSFLFICGSCHVNRNLCWTNVEATRVTDAAVCYYVDVWICMWELRIIWSTVTGTLYKNLYKHGVLVFIFSSRDVTVLSVTTVRQHWAVSEVTLLSSFGDEVVFGEFGELHNRRCAYCSLTLELLSGWSVDRY